jgi:CubicO group peptidase (beta-lactamase class C family)
VTSAATEPVQIVDLSARLQELLSTTKVPAIAAAVVDANGGVARGVAGVRKAGDPTPVQITDLWHLGSITKSFTSTTCARLVEAGKLRFDQPLAGLLPEAAGTPYAQVTLEQLLSHHAGTVANPSTPLLLEARTSTEPLMDQRRKIVTEVLAATPVNAPGGGFLYSNAGYVTVGAALERLTGMPWEDLVRQQVITPLGLQSAGFGAPGKAGAVEQPYGHLWPPGATRPPIGIVPGPLADNPASLGPAGTLHMSLDDVATYLRDHMNGEAGAGSLLRADTYQRLHKSGSDNYALGWVDVNPEWLGEKRVVWHNGSNTMWYAVIGFQPESRVGVAVLSNGGAGSEAIVTRVFRELMKEQVTKPGA